MGREGKEEERNENNFKEGRTRNVLSFGNVKRGVHQLIAIPKLRSTNY